MIIDATKINYFHKPERSTFDKPHKKHQKHSKEEVGVIIDVSSSQKKAKKILVSQFLKLN